MTLGTIFLGIFMLLLLGARPARTHSFGQQELYWYNVCHSHEDIGNGRGVMRKTYKEADKMNILEHTYQGATIKLDQRELLLVMALVHEGRESFDCNTDTAKGLDELFKLANLLVEESRRRNLRLPTIRKRIHLVAAPIAAQGNVAPNR